MTKEQKEEDKYLTTIINSIIKILTDNELIKCQKAFDNFCKNINKDKLGLLRKGEVFLRNLFI